MNQTPLSWYEIRSRALKFANNWADAHYEKGQAQPFLLDFFEIFGITNKRLASFEHAVKKYGGDQGFIDLFWPGVLLVEMKSRGRALAPAHSQALEYFAGIKEADLPRYILVSDFAQFALTDLESGTTVQFALADLHNQVKNFGFIAGYPWPTANDKQQKTIADCAQAVLDARALYPEASLADLYDPRSMPAQLSRAHAKLDAAVDAAYSYKGASTDAQRVAFLFGLYERLTSTLLAGAKSRKKTRSKAHSGKYGSSAVAQRACRSGGAWMASNAPLTATTDGWPTQQQPKLLY